jgi:hypothetical protein
MKEAAQLRDLPERVFTKQVIDLARWNGWRVAHFRPALTKGGRWVTAVQGDGAGFLDLVMVRGDRIIFAELKSADGKLRAEQERWYLALLAWSACLGTAALVTVWRPTDWPEIEKILAK